MTSDLSENVYMAYFRCFLGGKMPKHGYFLNGRTNMKFGLDKA